MRRVNPLSPIYWSVGVDFLAHARQERARRTGRTMFRHALIAVIHLERNFMQLGDGVATHLARDAVVVCDALGALLQPPTHHRGLVANFADDEDGAHDTGREALQDDGLVVINSDLGAVRREGDRIGWGGRIISLRWRWRRCIGATGRLVHVDDIHDERI